MEIGSEFHTNSATCGENNYIELLDCPKRYVLSGRTGLHLIAEELKTRVGYVLLPDYCCGSMIAPFVAQGIDVSFYSAFELNHVVIGDMVDAVLIMDYFGFVSTDSLSFAQRCREQGKIVIVDATQTAFSRSPVYTLADYIVVSYRKWFDSLCGVVYSRNDFITPEFTAEHPTYVDMWRRAAVLKGRYIKSAAGEKQEFLTLYAAANQALDNRYERCKANISEIDVVTHVDSACLRNQRRENARILIDAVKTLSKDYNVQLMYSDISDEDCPLFVPILVDESKRSFLRTQLSKEHVYCPCHWPIDGRYAYKETLYHRREISLICDQRYCAEDMRTQVNILVNALDASNSVIVGRS